jgi:RHS repeat-associated protein
MVEQWDTEELGVLKAGGTLPDATNIDESSYVPPAYTKTWFHTGGYLEGEKISRHFEDEYYHEADVSEGVSGLTVQQLEAMLLSDTDLPNTLKRKDGSSVPWQLTTDEIQEACRALKGSLLRREIYARDGTDAEDRPYSATEQNFTIELFQPRAGNKRAVFVVHPRESIDFHYERKLVEVAGKTIADPRVTHAMTLEVDAYGNVLKSVAIGYGRRPGLSPLQADDKDKQEEIHVTYTENEVTNAVEELDAYRAPLLCEVRTYELIELPRMSPTSSQPEITNLFSFDEILGKTRSASDGQHGLTYENSEAVGAVANQTYRRLIEQIRTLYRKDNLTGLLPLGVLDSLALPGESYKLAFTPGLLAQVFQRNGQALLPNPANVLPVDMLSGQGADRGGYVDLDGNNHWWIPSGRMFLSPNNNDTATQELTYARQHFFVPHRNRNPFYTNAVSTESHITYDAYDLLLLETRDALGNTTSSVSDYRLLAPRAMTDPNGNRSEVAFDVLGMVVGTMVMGKVTENLGDSLANFVTDLNDATVATHLQNPLVDPQAILQRATTRLVYDLFAYSRTKSQPAPQPAVVYTLARETHDADLPPGQQTKIQHSFSYSDGFGREIQKKIQAEPGPVPQRDANGQIIVGPDGQPVMTPNPVSPRWVGSGWTIFNNKGKPVRQYEPFFTDTHPFEFDVKIGVSPVLFYDPVERVVATLHPNHTYEKVVFDPWQQTTYDVNDTVLNADDSTDPKLDEDVAAFFSRLPPAEYLPTWYEQRITLAVNDPERDAADKAAVHRQTPAVAYLDTLGRTFLTVAHNKFKYNNTPPADPPIEAFYRTRIVLDIEGNQRAVRDAIVQNGDQQGRIVMRYDYDMFGNRIHQASMEAGERWMLNDVADNPLYAWDSRNHQFRTVYDPLRRPTDIFLSEGNSPDILIARTVYGESQLHPETKNQRGKVLRLFDQAGVVISEDYDFKGNLLQSKRQVAREYKTTLNWSAAVPLESETYTSSITYDALNRPLSVTSPDGSVYRPTFNEANLLEKVDVNLRSAQVATSFVTDIDYNAKGQRTLIVYGNGATSTYAYDPKTFRLIRLNTTRAMDSAALQDLHYTYDPMGNITQIQDDAHQTIYFSNQAVTPDNDYIYDAIYRLIEAKGREHIGQASQPETTWSDEFRVQLQHPQNGQAMRRYTERFEYDPVGNFEEIRHVAANSNWTRTYTYNEASLLEPHPKTSNRLTSTTVGVNNPEVYPYDAHGNMLVMAHLPQMDWDFRDQLHHVNLGGGGNAYYVYDAGGQRVRKVIEKNGGTLIEERIYLGGLEIFRRRNGAGTVTLERETLHVMDDKQRISLVETKTLDIASPLTPHSSLVRYQFSNHLGSAGLELDDQAQIISYEEYYPYGSTSYQAGKSGSEVSLKRYRYTGKERDEESGLNYHGARYYGPWLGRWLSTDPVGIVDHINMYVFGRNNPINLVDLDGRNSDKVTDAENALIAERTRLDNLVENDLEAAMTRKGELEVQLKNDAERIKQIDAELKELKPTAAGYAARRSELENERLWRGINSALREPELEDAQKRVKEINSEIKESKKKIKKLATRASKLGGDPNIERGDIRYGRADKESLAETDVDDLERKFDQLEGKKPTTPSGEQGTGGSGGGGSGKKSTPARRWKGSGGGGPGGPGGGGRGSSPTLTNRDLLYDLNDLNPFGEEKSPLEQELDLMERNLFDLATSGRQGFLTGESQKIIMRATYSHFAIRFGPGGGLRRWHNFPKTPPPPSPVLQPVFGTAALTFLPAIVGAREILTFGATR